MPVEHLDRRAIQRIDRELDIAAGPGHPASALRPGTLSPRGTACAGEDGYLFISDGVNAWERQYRGEFPATEAWRRQWADLFARRRTEAAARGVRLANLVCPEKQSVLPDKRWGSSPPDGAARPLRRLLEQAAPGDALIYPAQALTAASHTQAPAFFRHNSHWTASGCLAAADAVLQALGAAPFADDLAFAAERRTDRQDLTVHFFQPPPTEDMLLLTANGVVVADNQQLQKTGRHAGSSYAIRNEAAPDRRTLALFGDSFAYDAGLTYALSAAFSQVVFTWSKDIDWARVDELGAALVLWESAERFLVTIPAA